MDVPDVVVTSTSSRGLVGQDENGPHQRHETLEPRLPIRSQTNQEAELRD